jgi:copper(I)-binding protein
MRIRWIALGTIVLLLTACSSSSHPDKATPIGASASVGSLKITNAYVPAPASADVAAGYFDITNTGSTSDNLVRVTSDVATDTSLHTYASSGAGSEQMTPLSTLAIAAGATVRLTVGAVHVMIMNPTVALKVGVTVKLTLTFTHAGDVTIAAPVLAQTGPLGTDTGMASMSNMPGM